MDNTTKTGSRIREARIEAGLSQVELAEKIGSTPPAVSMWENYKREPSAKLLRRLSKALGVSVDWLLDVDAAQHG